MKKAKNEAANGFNLEPINEVFHSAIHTLNKPRKPEPRKRESGTRTHI